ncbi:nucleotidyltransferase domain-containing protein [Streptomyces sp. NPDC093018]|uniref:nucleotidyltransferase domain-containing protein n=1 Tax=Streptomyces sp. NPDC093018 TaxID=3155067 RepID=UPI00341A65CD
MPSERLVEVREFLDRLTRWAGTREDVVLLTADPARYLTDTAESEGAESDAPEFAGTWDDWAGELSLGRPARTRAWGPVTERRYALLPGLEVEFGIGGPRWARTDPVDPGTRRVVADGARALYDPRRILAELVRRRRP